MIRNAMSCIVVAGAVFLTSGCLTMEPNRQGGEKGSYMSNLYVKQSREDAAEMSVNLQFEDIPVPSGFKLDFDESFVFKNGITRVGITRYIGNTDLPSLTSFFKSQMPMYNWELVNSIEYKRTIINFAKEDQTCTLILEYVGKMGGKVFLTIASGPVGQ